MPRNPTYIVSLYLYKATIACAFRFSCEISSIYSKFAFDNFSGEYDISAICIVFAKNLTFGVLTDVALYLLDSVIQLK